MTWNNRLESGSKWLKKPLAYLVYKQLIPILISSLEGY
jgi:hypothetical protein